MGFHIRLSTGRKASPIGDMLLAWDEREVLRVLDFSDYEARMTTLLRLHYGAVELTEKQPPAAIAATLDKYFAGDIAAIDSLEVLTGGTEFQQRVWAALRTIPPGATESYGALAQRLGSPKAVRAVGGANGANPIGIVVPCHRVIGSNKTLTGYGGGLHRKQWLLAHESAHCGARDLFSNR